MAILKCDGETWGTLMVVYLRLFGELCVLHPFSRKSFRSGSVIPVIVKAGIEDRSDGGDGVVYPALGPAFGSDGVSFFSTSERYAVFVLDGHHLTMNMILTFFVGFSVVLQWSKWTL